MKSIANVLSFIVILALRANVGHADDRSLQITDSETPEASALIALEKLVAENRKLRADFDDARRTAAVATAEAEIFKRQVQELTLRMEALGASTANPSKLEQRLLQAVHDLRLSEKNRNAVSAELLRIAEVAHGYLAAPDAESKLVLQTELRRADETLVQAAVGDFAALEKNAAEPTPDLLNGKVSAVKPELGCVVINLGSKHGVKAGMPFQVRRGTKVIATVRVVDARQTFAGTVIQNLVSERDPIQLGDTVRVDAQMN